MKTPVIIANYRIGTGTGSAHRTRRIGQVPGIVYDNAANKIVCMNKKDLDLLIAANGINAVVDLQLGDSTIKAMIVDVQYHPVTKDVIHIDFKPVFSDSKVHTHVPIRFIGMEYAESNGGIVQKQKQSIEIRCSADKIPKFIPVDLNGLRPGQSFKVQDVEFAEEFTILDKPTEVLALITTPNNYDTTVQTDIDIEEKQG